MSIRGALLQVVARQEAEQEAHVVEAALLVGLTNVATPLLLAWLIAPPSSSSVTSSPVTVFTTSGPVMNMWLVSRTMKMKSVIAGLYTAPPAHGPRMTEICGTTPLDSTLR